MNATSSNPSEFDNVSSLYGPGTVIGWYMTLVGMMMSWVCHPVQARRDSIGGDLVLYLTLPVLAAGHLLRLPERVITAYNAGGSVFVADAPIAILLANMLINLWVSSCAGFNACWKRAMLSSIVGIACTGIAFFWMLDCRNLRSSDSPDRSACYVTLIELPILYTGFPFLAWVMSPFGKQSQLWNDDSSKSDQTIAGNSATMEGARSADNNGRWLLTRLLRDDSLEPMLAVTIIAVVVLAVFIVLFFPFSKELFQYTNSRISACDQIAGIIAGAFAMVLNLQSILRYWYGWQKNRKRKATHTTGTDGIALSAVRVQYSIDPDLERGPQADTVSGVDAAAESLLPSGSEPASKPTGAS